MKIPLGTTVVCDTCNEDYTNNPAAGGAIIGSYACCPKCVAGFDEEAQADISARCPDNMPFNLWVIGMRDREAAIEIRSF